MSYQRARKAEHKAERRESILTTARALSQEQGVMNWSLNELGRRADVNKSNLYRYFGSREEILMTLMHEEMNDFVDSFRTHANGRTLTPDRLASLLADLYTQRPLFCDLLSLAASILEHNIDLEPIRAIKLESGALGQTMAQEIANSVEGIDESAALNIATTSSVFATGLWPLANPATVIHDLVKMDGLHWLERDFRAELKDLIYTYILGMLAKNTA